MYCHNCGAQIPDEAKFCTECGTRIVVNDRAVNSGVDNQRENRIPAQQTLNQSSEKKQSRKKSRWLGRLIIVLIVFAALKVMSENGSTSSSKETTNAATSQAASAIASPSPLVAETPEPVVYEIGETATFNNLEFTITGYTFSNYAGGLSGLNPTTQDNVNLVVYINVYNPTNDEAVITKEALLGNKFGKYHFPLYYDGDVQYNSNFYDYTDFLLANEKILPLGSLTGKILNYTVPIIVQNSDKSLTITISGDFSSEGDPITFRLR